jgi:trans-2,3-dihydro-3-hydroxyanthranilate isomerase
VARYRYNVVDVFTDTPLTGNQLAVFTDARGIPEEMLQPLAREMNFSETVFVYPPTQRAQAGGTAQQATSGRDNDEETVFVYPSEVAHARIRIFTPAVEVPFAGHPTLGSAFVLAGPLQLDEIALETDQGSSPRSASSGRSSLSSCTTTACRTSTSCCRPRRRSRRCGPTSVGWPNSLP